MRKTTGFNRLIALACLLSAGYPAQGQAQELNIASPSGVSIRNPGRATLKEKVETNEVILDDSSKGRKQPPRAKGFDASKLLSKDELWGRYYRNGVEALNQRKYKHAEEMLLESVKEAKNTGTPPERLNKSRLALAKLYLFSEKLPSAYEIYRITLPRLRGDNKESIRQQAECHVGLARCQLIFNDKKRARVDAEKAVELLSNSGDSDSQLFGRAVHELAKVMADHGWYQDAKVLFHKAREILEKHPGQQGLILADALREESLFYHKLGQRNEANSLYDRSYMIEKRTIVPNQPPSIAGEVRFRWEVGSTRSKEIIDSEFPLRYVSAGGIRVAATVIDLWELMGVLVCVTNLSDHQQEFELGPVELLLYDPEDKSKKTQVIEQVNPKSIDLVQKELSMWTKTHTRPWLANIQKTRNVRGLVPPDGHDMFMGPNVFGVYGHWQAISHTVPQRVGVMPSREGLITNAGNVKDVALPGLLRSGSRQFHGLTPVWLEPFESRTGELFSLNHRDMDIIIRVPVGNAIFDIPFHTRAKHVH